MNGTATATRPTTTTASTGEFQGQRFFSVLSNLRQDLTDMLKSEMNLLKAELSEKVSCVGRQGMFIGIGAVVALLGATLLLVGICGFIAFGLSTAGMSPLLSFGIAFAAFGAVVAGVGYGILNKGIKTLSKTKIAPEQTVRTVKEIAKPESHPVRAHAGLLTDEEDDDKSHQVKAARIAAEKKIDKVQREAAEIRARLNPKYLWAATCTAAKRRPKTSAGIGASIVALGYFLIRRRRSHA